MVKFSAVAVAAVFMASCYSDLPELPASTSIQICKYKDAQGKIRCKSTYADYAISKAECDIVSGTLWNWTAENVAEGGELHDCEDSE